MSRQFDSQLFHAARHTFENLAFMLSLEEDDGGTALLPARRSVRVDFTGPFSGQLVVSISPDLMPTIAMNMLGVEAAELSPAQQEDAFKELADVVCGNLLPALAEAQAVFAVGAPALLADGDAPAAFVRTPAARARLTLENGAAELALYVNEDSRSDLSASAASQQITQ
jgi:CheY-specific phosphatase CheX